MTFIFSSRSQAPAWERRMDAKLCCGALAPQAAWGLTLRPDHGSQFMSHGCQSEIAYLGIASSLAFVRASEGKGIGASVL
jgi:putative transposase